MVGFETIMIDRYSINSNSFVSIIYIERVSHALIDDNKIFKFYWVDKKMVERTKNKTKKKNEHRKKV